MRSDQNDNRSGQIAGVARAQQRREAETLALRVLAYVVGDDALGPRLLGLTGLDVTTLRAHAGDNQVLAATLGFLAEHEPSLIACARALDVGPAALIDAHRVLIV